jgi:membrane fusion protein (multidrug efflux system)
MKTKIKILAVLLLLALAGGSYAVLTANMIATDDAFIAGRVVTISPKISGYIVKLNVDDNQEVKTGDVLAIIDPRDAEAKIAALNATLVAQRANLEQAKSDLTRANAQSSLSMSTQTRELAQTKLRVADADVIQTQAQITLAQLDLEHTRLVAPYDGRIAKRGIELNSYVEPGQALMAVVSNEFWVVANYKESQLHRIRLGQNVAITIDAFPDLKRNGKVESIQSGTGSSFSVFPAENATGNFVKIVQRVPVKITFTDPLPPNLHLAIGMSVVPTIDASGQ